MNLKQRMVELAEERGRQSLYPYAAGRIKAIIEEPGYTDKRKVEEIRQTLFDLKQTWRDESLPWDHADAKKASTAMEAARKNTPPECIINLSKVESLILQDDEHLADVSRI